MSKRLHQKGFTLIELLVVIAIIGILAAVVVVSVGNSRQRARTSAFESTAKNLQTNAARYCDENQAATALTPANINATNLSTGITVGTISGVNCASGTYTIPLTATNGAGGTYTGATITETTITYTP